MLIKNLYKLYAKSMQQVEEELEKKDPDKEKAKAILNGRQDNSDDNEGS